MPPLSSEQLDAVQRLLLEPLRETVKAELQLSHDRLAAAIEGLTRTLADQATQANRRIEPLERELSRQRTFRRRLAAIYGVAALLLSVLWELLRERVVKAFTGGKD